jgi:hypothetical protein
MRKLLGAGTPRELRNHFGTRMLRNILRQAPPFLRVAFRVRQNRFTRDRNSAPVARYSTRSRAQLRRTFLSGNQLLTPRAANCCLMN